MYCKKCHKLLNENETKCPKCLYDNDLTNDDFKIHSKKKKQLKLRQLFLGFAILLILPIMLIVIHIKSNDTTKNETNNIDSTVMNKFTFGSLQMSYDSTLFGTSASTIFFKTNNAFNIEIKAIDETTYNNSINENMIDKDINGITTKNWDEENVIKYLISVNNEFFIINVNYIEKSTMESTKIQLELAKIINSIQEKS